MQTDHAGDAILESHRRGNRSEAEEGGVKARVFFAWYDLWIGAFVDRKKRTVYICLIPTIVIKLTFWGSKCYVLLKRGYFYRPGCSGYTMNISEAGRFTFEQAFYQKDPYGEEPVTMEHVSHHLK